LNILLFGAPGVGKGTQSSLLVEKLDMRHISTGDLFRLAIKNETDLGLEAKLYMDKGELVPDSVVIAMVREVLENLHGQGFILDGFPRTCNQAKELDVVLETMGMSLDKVISIAVPEKELIVRLTGRRVCSGCGAVYHIKNKPSLVEGVCDICSAEVTQRVDDHQDAISTRLDVYKKNTEPVKDLYRSLNKLIEIDGVGGSDVVFTRVKEVLS